MAAPAKIPPLRSIVLLSGGPRSTAALLAALGQRTDPPPMALFMDYGQRAAAAEREASRHIAQTLGAAWMGLGLPAFRGLSSSARLSASTIDMGAQEHPRTMPRVRSTLKAKDTPHITPAHFVPGLPLLLLSCAGGYATTEEGHADQILWGSDLPDDAQETLTSALRWSTALGTTISLIAPLADKPLESAFQMALVSKRLEVMRSTVSCLLGQTGAWMAWGQGCGVCPGCTARRAAWERFAEAAGIGSEEEPEEAPELGGEREAQGPRIEPAEAKA